QIPEGSQAGSNYLLGREFTHSYHEKAGLRLMLEAWRGTKYEEGETIDLKAVLGRKCLLNIKHKRSRDGSQTYAVIEAVSPLPKNIAVRDPAREPIAWEIAEGAVLDELPAWLPYVYGQSVPDRVRASKEWQALVAAGKAHGQAPPGQGAAGAAKEE